MRKAKSVSKVQKLNAYSCNREGLRERLPPLTKKSPLNMLKIKGKLPAYSLHPEDSLTKLAKLAHVNPHIPARSHTLDTYIFFHFPNLTKVFSTLTLFPTNSTSFSSPSRSLKAPLLSAGKRKNANLVPTGFLRNAA